MSASLHSVNLKLENGQINGFCDPRFARVAEEFERNFKERGELGASVCLTVEGETMVDLWGGIARAEENTPWQADTISVVWSCTKGATALCAHILATRGLLDLDAPVARYWPEFAQNGKEAVTVKMLLNHTAGIPALRQPIPPGGFADWDLMVNALAAEKPFWQPGLMCGYHGLTFGWPLGEVIRRVSGKSLGAFFREEVAEPLGLDFWIGLPEEHEGRTARLIPAPLEPEPGATVPSFTLAMADPESVQSLLFMNMGGYMFPDENGMMTFDSPAAHRAEIGASGGITNARGLAWMYAPLANGGRSSQLELVNATSLYQMSAVSASVVNAVLLLPTRFSLGYFKTTDNRRVANANVGDSMLLSEAAFGHPGFGGSLGFADPEARLSFGYTMNRMGQGICLNPRGQSLVDATYQALGYRSNEAGAWVR